MQVISRGPFQEWMASDGVKSRFECIEVNYGQEHAIFREFNDHDSGLIILSDTHHTGAKVDRVEDLAKELPELISNFGGHPTIHWGVEINTEECESLLASFKKASPAYMGIQ